MRPWQRSLVGLELRKLLTYRLNFWTDFLGMSLFHLGVAYFVWTAVYSGAGATVLGGYRFSMILLYNFLVPIIGRATYTVDFSGMSDEIYSGSLNRYLIYPISFFTYRLIQQFTTNLMVLVQLGVAMLAFAWIIGLPAEFTMTPMRLIAFLVALLGAMFLAFLISWSIQLVAFWADQVWSLMVSFRFFVHFLGGAWIPMALFPDSIAAILRLSPFYLVVGFPIEIFVGKLGYADALGPAAAMVVWIALLAVTARWVWSQGLKVYSGVGV